MSQPVRLPDPVYQKATRQAERKDVSRGAVIKEWAEKAEKFDELEVRR